jgi:lipid-A-disaccharide synthase
VTTELALAGVPMVVGYRLGEMTHAILKLVFKSPWITLFNIAAKSFVAPEFVQDQCTGEKLAAAVAERLDDPALRERQAQAQNEALTLMGRGGPDPSEAAADAILKLLAERTATTAPES